MNWQLEDSYLDTLQDMFAPYNTAYENHYAIDIGQLIYDIAELQHHYLIELELDRYLCGVDNIMEIGYGAGIVSQPPRMSFAQMAEADPETLQTLITELSSSHKSTKTTRFSAHDDGSRAERGA